MRAGESLALCFFFLNDFTKNFRFFLLFFSAKKKRERKRFVSGRLSKLTVTETRTMEQTGSESTGFGSFLFVCLFVVVVFFLKIETSERFAARKQKVAKSTNRGESKFERR